MKIFSIEKNYPKHNKECVSALYNSETPIVYLKADSSLLKDHKPFFIPDWSDTITFGASVVVRICRLGKAIPTRFAHRYYDAVTVGIDVTARDLQRRLSRAGLPWELSKSFDGASIIGEWVDKDKLRDVQALPFHIDINGTTAQEGLTSDMIHTIDGSIAYISNFFTLKTGDLLFTGTPVENTVPRIDDHVTGYIDDSKVLEFNCK